MADHELFDFLKQSSDDIQAEYERISKRSREDSGTAGDEGEENWRNLLSRWLPPNYRVVTKGRVIFQNGKASPQMDVLVLSPEYPKGLIDAGKKLYLAGGVLAAFECKLTLRQEHIREAFEKSRALAEGLTRRWGSPYRELHKPIVYGLLAHSHDWKRAESQPTENINRGLQTMLSKVDGPRQLLDVLCVSDVGTWTVMKLYEGGCYEVGLEGITWRPAVNPGVRAGYALHHRSPHLGAEIPFTNVGAMVADVLARISMERPELRGIASYFHSVPGLKGDATGSLRGWTFDDIFSRTVQLELSQRDSKRSQLPIGMEDKDEIWSEWFPAFGW